MISFSEIRENPEAKRLAWAFDTNPRRSAKLRYFELMKMFMDPHKSGTTIASEASIAVSTLSVLYAEHFAPFVGPKTLHERMLHNQRVLASKRQSVLVETLEEAQDARKRVVDAAKSAGYTVRPDMRQKNETTCPIARSNSVIISGHRCSIRTLRKAAEKQDRKRHYAETTVDRRAFDAFDGIIFVIVIEGYLEEMYIVPSNDLKESLFADGDPSNQRRVFIPLYECEVKRKRRLDFSAYRNSFAALGAVKSRSV